MAESRVVLLRSAVTLHAFRTGCPLVVPTELPKGFLGFSTGFSLGLKSELRDAGSSPRSGTPLTPVSAFLGYGFARAFADRDFFRR